MTYEKFKLIIESLQSISEKSSSLYKLGVDLLDYNEPYHTIISTFMVDTFGEAGADWIDWYLYERPSFKDGESHAWDKDGNKICYDIPSLWENLNEKI